jgi:ADP-heptose:LPS heptosyltransferase
VGGTRHLDHLPEDRPEIARLLTVTAAVACPPVGDDIALPVSSDEDAVARALLDEAGLHDHAYVCLHPGASRPERRWSADRFAATADHVARQGLPVVLTGSLGEQPLIQKVMGLMRHQPVVDLAGRTSIGVLGALYRRARLVLTNDTGASHVAAAVQAASVVVFGSADPNRWALLDAERHRRVTGEPLPEGPPLADVTAAVDTQLARFDGSTVGSDALEGSADGSSA